MHVKKKGGIILALGHAFGNARRPSVKTAIVSTGQLLATNKEIKKILWWVGAS